MKILFIGDIVGAPGREKICAELKHVIEKHGIAFTVAQGEHIAGRVGVTESTANKLLKAGVDCITTGNHVWHYRDVYKYLEQEIKILRPANYPEGVPGHGHAVYEKNGVKIGIINLEGRVFMKALDDPFRSGRAIAEMLSKETPNIFVDFHAEATSEKRALGYHLSDLVTGFIGTHTHVQTADEQIIGNKMAYITEVGMVGSADSVIGIRRDEIIEHFLLSIPQKFKEVKDNIIADCVIIEFDEKTGTALSIKRHRF
jgi:metallophosphoesterase (TIGR00282 family)